ncbi:MAG TPA: SDR family oxidoreductase [Armatimonadota bacterium]|jgi:3-oxoacyl-[acyl-carrier protein] reductase
MTTTPRAGRVALVTGASRGLGAAIARELAAAGARVALNYHQNTRLADAVVADICQRGGTACAFRADITDEAQVREMIGDIRRTLGPVEIVVNNATGPQPMLPIEAQSWQDHLDQLVFFVKAPLLILQAVLPDMKAQRSGRIINIGSEVVEMGNAEYGTYVAAKAAMLGLTRSWANELGPFGITVNLVAPGWIPVERHDGMDPAHGAAYASSVALRHQGAPQDIAHTVAFLASDAAAFITGQKLAVNGGKTLL